MIELDREQLLSLSRWQGGPCISLLLPLPGLGVADRQSPVRLSNLLRRAEQLLAEEDLPADEADRLTAPIAALADTPEIWLGRRGGLAVYSAAETFFAFHLPFEVDEEVEVGEQFRIRPLLPILDQPATFYLLALSLGDVRLLEVGPGSWRRCEVAQLPQSFDAAMNYEQYDRTVTAHSNSSPGLGRPGVVHGHGDGDEEHFKDDVLHFFRRIAEAVGAYVRPPDTPVVVAAVGAHHPLFRRAGRALRLDWPGLVGSPDGVADRDLVERARHRVREATTAIAERELAHWAELRAGGRTLDTMPEIVAAAGSGRLAQLFIARGSECWGKPPVDRGKPRIHAERQPEDVDLIELAASRTLANRGQVRVVDAALLPANTGAVATLRYAIAA